MKKNIHIHVHDGKVKDGRTNFQTVEEWKVAVKSKYPNAVFKQQGLEGGTVAISSNNKIGGFNPPKKAESWIDG